MSVRLAKSAGLVSLATLSSRVLGLVRDGALTRFFGAGVEMDAFLFATRIPTLLRELFAEGAMSAAFVPTFTRRLSGRAGRSDAWRLGSLAFNALLVITGAIVAAGIALAGPITAAYAPEFAGVATTVAGYRDKLDLAIGLTRITMPFLTVIALSAVLMGMLNALGRFFIPAFAPAVYNIVLTITAVLSAWFGPRVGIEPIVGLAWGFVLGGVGQFLVQWPAIRREGFRHQWVLDVRDPGLHEIMRLMGPGTIGNAASQINLFVNTVLATSLGTGPISYLNYAFRLMYLPIGIFGVSVATAVLPDLSRHATTSDHAEIRRTLSWGLRLMLALNVPATLGLIALAVPIIELIFEGGKFTSVETAATASALMFYAPGLIGYSTVKIVSPTFYAMHDARTPMLVSLFSVAANVVLNLTLVRRFGFQGLALGTALAATINAGLLVLLLRPRIGGLDGRRIAGTFVRITLASIAMALAAVWVESTLHQWLPEPTFWARLVRVGVAIVVALGVLALAAMALRIQEFQIAMSRVLARVRR
ncbi:MAG TPA: murein biosynthesis integral membrane protein MurJ [Vicinamibacterales bacterium]|nr:murein biosynthesis integral membrane protein MurJ [Vicinamibacterales bacterium]